MDNELLRQKCVILRTSLCNLKYKLVELDSIYNELNLTIKSMLLIDNSILNEEDFINIGVINNEIRDEISMVVIPMLDKRI